MKTSSAVILTAVVTFLVTSGLWVVAFVAWQAFQTASTFSLGSGGFGSGSTFSVIHRCPPEVQVGDSIDLILEITNPGTTDEDLESIDLYYDFLNGFTITSVSEAYRGENMFGDFETLWIEPAVTIPAGTTHTVTITLEGAKPGTWSADVDVCGAGIDFATVVPRVEVKPAAP
ncbi:hypothetical protein [Haloferula sp. A504]|uniref:hypothetical protein n=1 Tax=Haloferula sp. A504 TaxID=3373601 RepID=UPI0031C9BDF4|nr:hypothetical protein [Verrucomicrobiaceae bacterium E54]